MDKNNNKDLPAYKKKGGPLMGIILIITGTIFLLNNYGFTNIDIGKLWPIFLIAPGIMILLEHYRS